MNIFTTFLDEITIDQSFRMSPTYHNVSHNFKNAENCISLDNENIIVESGSYIKKYVSPENGVPYLRVNNEKNYNIDESEMAYIEPGFKDKMKLKEFDVVFGRTQANLDKLGIFSLIDSKLDGVAISQHVSKIRIKNDLISPYYLVAYLNSKFGKSQMAYATYGDTRVELTHSQVKKIKIIKIDSKLQNTVIENSKIIVKKNREALDSLKKAQDYILDKLSFKKNDNESTYNVNLSDLIENDIWNVTNYKPEYISISRFIEEKTTWNLLSNLTELEIKSGCEVGSKNYLVEFEKNDNDYAFIRTSDIINNSVDMFPDYFVHENVIPKNKFPKLKKYDILFSKDAKIGEVTILNGEERIVPGSGFSIIRIDKNKVLPQYVFCVLSLELSKDQALQKTVIASTIPHLKINKLSKIKVPLLTIDDQEYVAQLIDNFILANKIKNEKIIENKKIMDSEYDKLFN